MRSYAGLGGDIRHMPHPPAHRPAYEYLDHYSYEVASVREWPSDMTETAILTLPALALTALALGARHALDADHLSVIDAVARRDALTRPWSARLAGLSFSVGHVLVVAAAACLASLFLDSGDAPPAWLATSGITISASALMLLGLVNLHAAWRPPYHGATAVTGWKSRWVRPADRHGLILLTGALFAISFDTIAIALGLGLSGKLLGGWPFALLACLAFGVGMILVGTANGALTVHLLRSASHRAAIMARAMTAVIGFINLALGLLAVAALLLPRLDAWREDHGLTTSGAVIGLCLAVFAGAALLCRSRPVRSFAARG